MPIKLFVIGLISFIFLLSSGCGSKQPGKTKSVAPIFQDTKAQSMDLINKFGNIAKEESNHDNKYMKKVDPGSTIITISNEKSPDKNKKLLTELAQLAKNAGYVYSYTYSNIPISQGNLEIKFYGDPKDRLNLDLVHPNPNTYGLKYISGTGLMIVGNQRPKKVVLMNVSP
jgi:hypothetical protein